jgi:hypothetical protein
LSDKDVKLLREAFIKKMMKYVNFLNTKTFQYAREGTKQYEYVDRRCGLLEDIARDALDEYGRAVRKKMAEAMTDYAQLMAAKSAIRTNSHDLWDKYVPEAMEKATLRPQRYVHEVTVKDVFEEAED